MTVIRIHRYCRADLRANPNVMFVFGDNMARIGFGGQAAEARGEPNAIGIPTLWSPGEFFADDALDCDAGQVRNAINEAFDRIREHLRSGGVVVLPADGVGTGIADMPSRAPKIFDFIQNQWNALK